MTKIKVLFTLDSLAQGGTEQSILELAKCFSNEIDVSVAYFYSNHQLLQEFKNENCKIYFLNLKGRHSWIKGIIKLYRLLKNSQTDLVVSSLYRSSIISRISCLLTHKKLIGTFVEDNYGEERIKTFRGIISKIKFYSTWLIDRLTAFIPNHWISNGKTIGFNNSSALGISLSKISIINRGRNVSEIKPWTPPKNKIFSFVSIGRLYEKKGFIELIDAFFILQKNHPDVSLVIYGEGPLRAILENKISLLQLEDKIKLAGNFPKAFLKLYDAHCFVFPSRFEGFSGSLIEAMMSGIPILCSDIPMNLEAVVAEKTALVHKINDVKDLEEKMSEMISNYSVMIEMGKRASATALEKYDIRIISKQYEELLKNVHESK